MAINSGQPNQANATTGLQTTILETRLKNLYSNTYGDLQNIIGNHFSRLAVKNQKKLAQLANGEITKQEYQSWLSRRLMEGARWENLKGQMAKRLTEANVVAAAYINDTSASIYSATYNYQAWEFEAGSGIAFNLADEQAVRYLMAQDPDLLPFTKASVNVPKDQLWNREKLQNTLASAILQGVSIDKMAKMFQQNVGMNQKSALRNARTMATSAHNAGRQEAFNRAESNGIKIKKCWIGSLDGRTRDSHRKLDGETIANDATFSNGCRFPGDPQGKAGEVFNCRCSMRAIFNGSNGRVRRVKNADGSYSIVDDITYTGKNGGALSYEDWLKGKGVESQSESAKIARALHKKAPYV